MTDIINKTDNGHKICTVYNDKRYLKKYNY